MNKLPDRLSGKFHITVNVVLLCVAIIAALAGIVERVLQSASSTTSFPLSLLINVVALLSILIIIGVCYALYRQGMAARSDQDFRASIAGSALLGSILLGLTAISLTDSTSRSQEVGGAAIIALSLVSLLFLMIFTTAGAPEPGETPLSPPPPPKPQPAPAIPSYNSRRLPPPFTNDPLFKVPVLEDPLLPFSGQSFYRVFSIPKPGEHPVFNEDACSVSRDQARFALCDGAAGSALARPWASLLGQQWLKAVLYNDETGIDVGRLAQWLEVPRARWRQWVLDYWLQTVNERNEFTGDAHVQNKEVNEILSTGAASTFLGVQLDRQTSNWRATAIGDTCLFLVSKNRNAIKAIMPITEAALFTQRPPLLNSSNNSDLNKLATKIVCHQQKYRPGEYLLMATDALAEWLITQEKRGERDWQELLSMPDSGSFSRFVEKRRERNQITEDDTTLVIIQL